MNKVLIIGGNHQNTLGVIEALGQKNILSNVIILGAVKSSFVLASRYILKGWICGNELEVISCIQQYLSEETQKVVSIACSDDAANILDKNYDLLSEYLIIPTVKEPGTLFEWTDKAKMTKTAVELGMTVPSSWVIKDKTIPEGIIYPCVVKPITSVNHGKKGFAKCNNEKELLAYLETKNEDEFVQVQQFIEKEFEFQFLGCSINAGEEVFIPGRTHIETTTGFNNLVFLRFDKYESSFEEIVSLSKRYIKNIGFSGLFSIEYMRGKDGKDYFLEMNYRNDGNGISVTSSGTNLPYIWYLYATGQDYKSEVENSVVRTTYMMPEVSFLMSMLNGEVSFREWWSDYKKTNCYLTRFNDDIKPYKVYIRSQRKVLLVTFIKYILVKLHIYPMIKRLIR